MRESQSILDFEQVAFKNLQYTAVLDCLIYFDQVYLNKSTTKLF